MGAACSQCAGCCKSAGNSIEDAGSEIGTSLLEKGKTMSGQTGSRILSRVESTFDDKVDKIIAEKFLERCDTTFDSAIDAFVGKTFSAAMKTFDPTMEQQQSTGDSLSPEALRKKEERIARLEETREQLRYCGLSQLLIEKLEQEGWLDQRNWDILPKDQLFAMGFGHGHIELFMEAVHKNKQKKRNAAEQLARWDIPQFLIDNMNEEGYLDQDKWEELQEEALHCEREGKEAVSKLEEEKRREFEEKYPSEISKKRKKTRKDDRVTINEQLRHQRQLEKEEARKKKIKEEGPIVLPYTYTGCRLHRLGFAYNHIESFLDGMERQAKANKPPEHVLLECGIPNDVIENMRKCRVLSPEKWADLTSSNLDEMGFKKKDEDKLFKALAKISHGEKDNVMDTTNSLEQEIKTWGIPNVLMERMKEVGWLHPDYWDDLLEHEYELEDLGFQHGHISTFRRKYQQWKDKEALKGTQRKIMRKLERPAKKQSALLKRKIDIFNATSEPVRVRIIGERKYGSMESTSGSASSQKDQASSRRQGSSMSSKNKSIQDASNESTSDTTKERSFKGGASAQVSATPVNASLSVDMSKKDTSSKTNKSTKHSVNEREAQRQSNDERSNKMKDASAVSQANTSQHTWAKVKVGFTTVMPNQTIEFPVQISDPNAVVYMTIYSFSGRDPICDNAQIDANYIKIDKVNIEGFGNKIRWQPGAKPPKSRTGADHASITARKGIFTIHGFCDYLEKRGVEGHKIQFIKSMLGNAEYDVSPKKDDPTADTADLVVLASHIHQVLEIYNKKKGVIVDNKEEIINQSNAFIRECIAKYLNTTMKKTIIKLDVVEIKAPARDIEDEKGIRSNPTKIESMKRIDSVLYLDKMAHFLHNKGIAPNKKIDWIHESLGGSGTTYVLNEDTKTTLIDEINDIITIYDKLNVFEKKDHITLENYKLRIEEYKDIILDTQRFIEDHESHVAKYQPFKAHIDDDSDDEELHAVEKFFDCDSLALLKSWGLSQFYERLIDEGWQNPLDWVHLDDHILERNIGFRPGHIQIFNRKFDLWVKRYNDVRRTIDPKLKGVHGVLIVGKGETKTLKSNYLYIFTKVIIREGGTLSVMPWSPDQPNGGVLFIQCHQDVVLEKNARISVDGKGYWGGSAGDQQGYGPGGGFSTAFACNGAGGASYASEGFRGYNLAEDAAVWSKKKIKAYRHDYLYGVNGDDAQRALDHIGVLIEKYGHLLCWDGPKPTAENEMAAGEDGLWDGSSGGRYWDCSEEAKQMYFKKCSEQFTVEDEIRSLACLTNDIFTSFGTGEFASKEAMELHRLALGSGGGCSVEIYQGAKGLRLRPKQGGAGGGVLRLMCDTLIMYEGSEITADGDFDTNGDPFSAGGSGGSIFITVTSKIIPQNNHENNININLFARGGGQKKMNKLYGKCTENEGKALQSIRRFEKLQYPRLQIAQREEKERRDARGKEARKNPNYIDSDDDDDDNDNDNSDSDACAVEATFDMDAFCTYLQSNCDYIGKDDVELIKNTLNARYIIEDVKDKQSKKKTFTEMLKAFQVMFDDWPRRKGSDSRTEKESKGTTSQVSATAVNDDHRNAVPDASALDMQNVMKYVSTFYLDLENAAIKKAELQQRPIAEQISLLQHEYKGQTKEDMKEDDLWLWKWKKMPK
eukprot:967851_1